MRKCFAVLCAAALALAAVSSVAASPMSSLTVVVPEVDVAAPGQSQTDPNLLTWQTYDSFPGSSLNTALWQMDGSLGTLSTGTGGLTLTPSSLSGVGHTDVGIQATIPINLGAFFAVRVPFLITAATAGISGNVDFNIDLCGVTQHTQCDSLGWALGNNAVPPGGGTPLSGMFFHAEADTLTFQHTAVSQGQLAMIYSGGFITDYVNDGTGWQQLGGPFLPPADWTPSSVPLTLVLSANVTGTTPPVPEPSSLALLGLGLAGIAFSRRKKA